VGIYDSERNDEELASLVQQGDEKAFAVLLGRYQNKLLRYGRKFLSSREDIEDIVQDVFIRTYQNIKSFDATRKFSPWIYRIAHNTFVNALRDKERDPIILLDLDALMAHPSHEDPREAHDRERLRIAIEKGLELLTPAYKEILILYYLEDLSYQEIADVLHLPVGTVGVRLRRAREMLKKYLSSMGNGFEF
jgi:RNA polymerase sigma-70 factor (ECF subfamily)